MPYEIRRAGVFDLDAQRYVDAGAPWFAFRRAWFAGAAVTVAEDANQLAPPTADEIAAYDEQDLRETIRAALGNDAAVRALARRSPADVDAWITANVTTLAEARAVLAILARIVAHLAREIYT